MPLQTSQILNKRYRIAGQLSQGGFGIIYRAWDMNLNLACAVKENLVTDLHAQRQFEREAVLLASLHHPNLPRVTDHFTIPGKGQYLVMDFVDGEDLQELLDRMGKPLSISQVLPWVEQVCDALTYLHNQQPPVIHRDIKPANIKIKSDGQAVLVDFGIAKIYNPQLKTTVGARAMTPGFSPIEQYGQGTTTIRSDIYALGATLYTLIVGQVPQESVQRASATRDPLIPAHLANPNVPRSVGAVIAKAMAVHPGQRYQNVNEFKQALKTALTSPVLPSTKVISPPVQPKPRRTATVPKTMPLLSGVAIGAGIMAVLLVAGLFVILPKILSSPAPVTSILVVTATEDVASASPSPSADDLSPTPSLTTSSDLSTPKTPMITSTSAPSFTPTPESDGSLPSMDPNSGLIAINSTRSGYPEIAVMNADGTGFRQLTNHKNLSDEPDFSPDGQRIAFERKFGKSDDWEIHIIGIYGDGERSLGDGRQPAWSPNGEWIAFEWPDMHGHYQIWLMTAEGGNREQLTWDSHANRAPNWSPDGRNLVMMSKIGSHWQIVIIELGTFQQTQITSSSTDKRFPVWSPDGQWIAYNTLRSGNPDQIWIVETDGGNEIQLTVSGSNGRPCWSPDGRYIVYNAEIGNEWKIARIAIGGSDYQIISKGGGDNQPDWTP